PKADPNAPPAYKGHDLPRLRGVMSPNNLRDEDLRHLGQDWHANLIRWQMTRNWGVAGTDQDLDEYGKWMDAKLDEAAQALDTCRKYGLKLVLDVHSPPGGRTTDNTIRMALETRYADAFVALWEKIATRFKGHPALWGYDLVNEPVQNTPPPDGVDDYLAVQVRAAKAIRRIDPTTPIIIEVDQWDSAAAYADFDPVDVTNVVYQVHMYVPGEFTHQGVGSNKTGIVYPGKINGVEWDKDKLRSVLQPVRDFQLAYNVHIYAGEFSAIRWAPGDSAVQYLRDVTDLFEEYGWDWSYHAYREWDGWSLEHSADPEDHQPTKEPGERLKLMLGLFAKNKQPLPANP
ncbi:MAG: cellulase family glycosylhydrolase, partial [Armatimonadetes bacterium]|nr:cellulase family glycosylhydrolase [Armatimonadota bacterium]